MNKELELFLKYNNIKIKQPDYLLERTKENIERNKRIIKEDVYYIIMSKKEEV